MAERRTQLELGLNWQMVPSGRLTWREWAFSPYAAVVWPGRELQYADMLDGTRGPGWMISVEEPAVETDTGLSVRGLSVTRWYARYWRIGLSLRVLGLDLGFGALYRPRNERELYI